MGGIISHGAGLYITGQIAFDANAIFQHKIQQRRILRRMYGMTNPLGTQMADSLPDGLWSGSFSGVGGDMPACITGFLEVLHVPITRKMSFISRQVQANEFFREPQFRLQLLHGNIRSIVPREDAELIDLDIKILFPGLDAITDRLDHPFRAQMMRLRHKPWAVTQFDVVDPFKKGIFNIFISHPAAGIIVH